MTNGFWENCNRLKEKYIHEKVQGIDRSPKDLQKRVILFVHTQTISHYYFKEL